MLKRLLPALAFVALSLGAGSGAQAQTSNGWRPCGAAELQELYLSQHPEARQAYEAILSAGANAPAAMRQQLQTTLLNPADTVIDITVPVVVHVMYYNIPTDNTNAPTNITDRQITDAIAIATRDFHRVNPDTSDIIPMFKSRIANIGFRFRLAKIDPNGNPTTGITRHYSVESDFGTSSVTGVVYWPKEKYLNLWITDDIASGAGGYTFGGALSCPANDGIVLRRSQFGPNTVCTANLCTRSLTHEIGHYFGLNHTWGQTNTPGVASNCGVDDGVADTPNTIGVTNGGCPTTMAGCVAGTIANVQNYMDYADCEKMFTTGQKAVIRNGILNSSCRRTLVSAANLIATGTNDGFVATIPTPVAFFHPNKTSVCEGGTVSFRSYSYNLNAAGGTPQYRWTFPGSSSATTLTGVAPTVTYPTAGVYNVTLTVTNNNGANTNTYTATNLIQVTGPTSGESAPFVDSFENALFPNYYTAANQLQRNYSTNFDSPTSYLSTNGWVRRVASGVTSAADGNAYLQVRNQSTGTSTSRSATSTLISPNINISNITSPVLSFSYYYGSLASTSTVALSVWLSIDCGNTWNAVGSYNDSQLNLTGTTYQSGALPTSPADYRTISIPITAYQGRSRLRVRFISTHNATVTDNPLYFDNLRLTGVLGTNAAAFAQRNISVFPNPLTNETAVHVNLPASTKVQVSLSDMLGRPVLALPAKTYAAGDQTIALPTASQALPAGVYAVRVTLDNETYTTKLVVQ